MKELHSKFRYLASQLGHLNETVEESHCCKEIRWSQSCCAAGTNSVVNGPAPCGNGDLPSRCFSVLLVTLQDKPPLHLFLLPVQDHDLLDTQETAITNYFSSSSLPILCSGHFHLISRLLQCFWLTLGLSLDSTQVG